MTPADGHWRAGVALGVGSLVFESDRGGSMQLWQHDLRSGAETRLTDRDDAPHSAAVSSEGVLAWFDVEERLWVGDRCVGGPFGETGRPQWLHGGRHLAFAASLRRSDLGRHGTHAIAVVDSADGSVAHHVPSVGGLSSRRGCGPVFSPDGRQAAVIVDGLPHVMDVSPDPSGAPAFGAAQRVSDESADWPVFDRDGVLFALHHGRLRRYLVGEPAYDMPLRFPVPVRVEAPPLAVRAGRIWDGLADGYRPGADIVIRDGRIAELAELGSYDGPHLIDELGSTAIPGLFDAHAHVTLAGAECLGQALADQYLAYGVTGLRSMGESLYLALEYREAASAGVRAAPRLYVCGELLDGEQVVGDNRAIRDLASLDREIDRHLALGVDIAKAYVRLPPALHRHLIARFAEAGVPVAGHYLYPNVWFGQASVEHFGSPSRYPVNALVTLTGRSYEDVTAPFAANAIALCPTLFNSRALAPRDGADSWDADSRTARLPRWQREKFAVRLGSERVGPVSRTGLRRHAETIAALVSAGAAVMSGTDVPHELPGLGVHLNMRALVLGGARPVDVLRGASLGVAQWLGEDVGPLVPGRPADFSLVDGDPLADIADAAATRWTVVGGRPFARDGSA
jgi:cytosine/adenosine deaminase-related metal-dependent hydrolase